jgi:hypothetical protein
LLSETHGCCAFQGGSTTKKTKVPVPWDHCLLKPLTNLLYVASAPSSLKDFIVLDYVSRFNQCELMAEEEVLVSKKLGDILLMGAGRFGVQPHQLE